MTHLLQLLAFMMFGVLLSMATILPPALAVASSSATFTLPIYTFRLDLTIREDDDDNNKNRRQLLRQNILPLVPSHHHHHHRSIQEIQSVESTIQSVAETHLAAIYAETFVAPPSQVLLTVVSEDEEENDKAPETGSSSSGIYIRSYFLGGVVSFPTSISKSSSSSSTSSTTVSIFDQLPTRSELAQVTLEAFQIPGTNGEGEEFLTELQDANHPDLKGLLLISAEEVKTTAQEGPTSSGGEDSTSTSSSSSGNGGTDSSSTTMTTTTTTTSSTPDENMEGSSSVSFMNMNIWAIAAVAALAAMLLVILFCTSILYCDWRKRRERRERKRERLAAMTAAASNIHNSNTNQSYYVGSFGDVDNNISNKKRAAGVEYLQIVVPTAGSGETEDVYISPSTQGGSGANSPSSPPLPQDNVGESFNSSTGSRRASSSSSSILGNKVKKYRRSSLPKSKNLMGKKQSKAVNDQLRLAENVEAQQQQQQQNQPQPPLIVNPQSFQPRVNGNGNVDMEDNEQYYYADTTAASATAEMNPDPNILITGSAGEDGYSVGEDTTVLFPTINRDRSGSKDYMSDFDGYSIDGMSAVDGGYSQFGGDSSGGGGGVRSSSKKSSTRDMYYAGDVPRDFDSVWGDDDASRITNDTTDGSADYPPGPPAAKNTFSLNKLIEHDYEEGSQSASAGRGTNLHEFETESETSGSRGQVAGAFTLELLGKSKTIRLHKSASGGSSVSVTPSSQDDDDDDDSILGRMYHDEESSELMAVVGDDNMSAIDVEDGTGDGAYNAGAVMSSRSGDSVDSTPSWAAPIQSALLQSVNKFRSTATENSSSSKDMQEKRIKEKFVSSLKGDDSSVDSNRSRGSQRSNNSSSSRRSNTSRKDMTAVLSSEKALGLTNSMDEEIDEDPTAMIDNINSMLSECRDILNTESSPQ